ncbi:MAG: hypothetical protein MUP83_01215, partial [Schleiferiaceae bacterium]|nr:hypothetical protein [Schleiferiaceae bacterium]
MKTRSIQVGNIPCGGDQLFLISGPCVIEGRDTMMAVAEGLAELREALPLACLIYKSSFTNCYGRIRRATKWSA